MNLHCLCTLIYVFYFSGLMPAAFHTNPDELFAYVLKSEGQHICGICNKFTHFSKNSVRNHVEAKHYPDAFCYSCDFCGQQMKNKNCLNIHISRHHRNKDKPQ